MELDSKHASSRAFARQYQTGSCKYVASLALKRTEAALIKMSIEFDFNFDQQEQYVNFSYEHELWSIIYGANGSQTILPALRNITKIQDNESLVWTTVHTLWTSKLLWDTVTQLRFLFYFVLPSETMFASLEQVPRYVTEVSLHDLLVSNSQMLLHTIHLSTICRCFRFSSSQLSWKTAYDFYRANAQSEPMKPLHR